MMRNCIVGSAAYYQSRTADASQAGTSKSARKRNKKKSSSPAEDPKSPSPEPINDVDAALGSLYIHMTLTLP
jgi:hypothetical protein